MTLRRTLLGLAVSAVLLGACPVCRVQASPLIDPPSIEVVFGAPAILLNGTATLTFTITNPAANTLPEVGVAFSDILPTGISPFFGSSTFVACGGTGSVAGQVISLAGGSVAANDNCAFSVVVQGNMLGSFTDTTGVVSSVNENASGNQATASIDVVTSLATPLPAALPLFATGIGGLGLLGWRRRRKAQLN